MSARLLVIALDGADADQLDRWTADGTLPCLSALRRSAQVQRLAAPEGLTDDALWASFQYGATLGDHGRYHWWQQLSSGTHGMAHEAEGSLESFWTDLSRAGARVAVLDVPKCGAPRPINGLHLVDWLVHGRYFPQPLSQPPALAAEVVGRFGPMPPSPCTLSYNAFTGAGRQEFLANLRLSVARKRAAGCHYLASEAWDLFLIGFKEAHCAGHLLWDQHEELVDVLLELDGAVGELVTAAGAGAAVAVFTPTRMGPNTSVQHLAPGIIKRLNFQLGDRAFAHLGRTLRSRLTGWPCPPPCEQLNYNENALALRINPPPATFGGGGRAMRRQKLDLLERVEVALNELLDTTSGKPLVRAIDRPSSEWKGPRSHQLPDLLVHGWPGSAPRAVGSARLGRIAADPPLRRPGNHGAGGLWMLVGAEEEAVDGVQDIAGACRAVLGMA